VVTREAGTWDLNGLARITVKVEAGGSVKIGQDERRDWGW
jgi:hypothetical protein